MRQEMDQIISSELMPGEMVLWSGKPDPSRIFCKADIFLVPFSFLWSYFVFRGFSSMGDMGVFLIVFNLFFIVIGLYLLIGRFIFKAIRKKHTCYAVTDQRVLIIHFNSAGVRKSCSSAQLKNIQNDSLSLGLRQTGSILFGPVPFYLRQNMNTGLDILSFGRYDSILAFFDISDASKVYDIYTGAKYRASV